MEEYELIFPSTALGASANDEYFSAIKSYIATYDFVVAADCYLQLELQLQTNCTPPFYCTVGRFIYRRRDVRARELTTKKKTKVCLQ